MAQLASLHHHDENVNIARIASHRKRHLNLRNCSSTSHYIRKLHLKFSTNAFDKSIMATSSTSSSSTPHIHTHQHSTFLRIVSSMDEAIEPLQSSSPSLLAMQHLGRMTLTVDEPATIDQGSMASGEHLGDRINQMSG